MIVDTSAMIAILRGEPGHEVLREKLLGAAQPRISAGTLLELRMVAERDGGASELADLLVVAGIEVVAFDPRQVDVAMDGFRQFGKGRHPAGLNFGDCFAYGLARALGEPLLLEGDDFTKTDVEEA